MIWVIIPYAVWTVWLAGFVLYRGIAVATVYGFLCLKLARGVQTWHRTFLHKSGSVTNASVQPHETFACRCTYVHMCKCLYLHACVHGCMPHVIVSVLAHACT